MEPTPSPPFEMLYLGWVIGAVVLIFLFILVALLIWCCFRRRFKHENKPTQHERNVTPSYTHHVTVTNHRPQIIPEKAPVYYENKAPVYHETTRPNYETTQPNYQTRPNPLKLTPSYLWKYFFNGEEKPTFRGKPFKVYAKQSIAPQNAPPIVTRKAPKIVTHKAPPIVTHHAPQGSTDGYRIVYHGQPNERHLQHDHPPPPYYEQTSRPMSWHGSNQPSEPKVWVNERTSTVVNDFQYGPPQYYG